MYLSYCINILITGSVSELSSVSVSVSVCGWLEVVGAGAVASMTDLTSTSLSSRSCAVAASTRSAQLAWCRGDSEATTRATASLTLGTCAGNMVTSEQ